MVVTVLLIPGISEAGGWNSSGGGGIACFIDEKVAAEAGPSGIIKDEYVDRILTLHALEMDGLLRGLRLRKRTW